MTFEWQIIFPIALVTAFGTIQPATATTQELVKETIMIPMRDRIKLATDIYLPGRGGAYPTVLVRTPYDKTALAIAGEYFGKVGYAVVVQDERGRFASEGENLPFEGDGWWGPQDAFDTLEWIAAQPWCNGKIGTWGESAAGFNQVLAGGAGSQRITCQHIGTAAPSLYDSLVYRSGLFRKALVEEWFKFCQFDPKALELWTSHPLYDAYWRTRDASLRFDKFDWPAVHLGGWYDSFVQKTIDTFVGIQTSGGPHARGKQKLVIGPWTHGMITEENQGEVKFPNAGSPPSKVHDSLFWYDHYLKGLENGAEKAATVTYYVMGDQSDPNAPGNCWRTANAWPPVAITPTAFYLHSDRSLSTELKAGKGEIGYNYDPSDPAPTLGGQHIFTPTYGVMDQRKIETRPDVLVFTSAPLTKPMELTGRVRAKVWASTDAPDTDFIARLCDVYPDGRSYNICEGGIRARLRESLSKETPLEPGVPYLFEIDLWSTSIIINKGHSLRLHVTSSCFPAYTANPNTGLAYPKSENPKIAHNKIYLDGEKASHLILPIANP